MATVDEDLTFGTSTGNIIKPVPIDLPDIQVNQVPLEAIEQESTILPTTNVNLPGGGLAPGIIVPPPPVPIPETEEDFHPLIKLNTIHCIPDWCVSRDKDTVNVMSCLAISMYNFRSTMMAKIASYQKIGVREQLNSALNLMNKINHISYFLFTLYLQHSLTDDSYESYITCDEIKCIKEQLNCHGVDITCLFECVNICGYTKNCDSCQELQGM